MRLSELKPCAVCRSPLLKPGTGTWYVVRVSQAMLNRRAVNQTLGLTQYFQGALGLAEVFSPGADDAVLIFGDKEPALLTEIHICFDCMHDKPLGPALERTHEESREAGDQAVSSVTHPAGPAQTPSPSPEPSQDRRSFSREQEPSL